MSWHQLDFDFMNMINLFYFYYLQDEETEALLSADFEIGHFFRERLIPKVILFLPYSC